MNLAYAQNTSGHLAVKAPRQFQQSLLPQQIEGNLS